MMVHILRLVNKVKLVIFAICMQLLVQMPPTNANEISDLDNQEPTYIDLAQRLIDAGELNQAEDFLKNSLKELKNLDKTNTNEAEINYLLGIISYDLYKIRSAKRYLIKSLKSYQDNPELGLSCQRSAHDYLKKIYIQNRELKQADSVAVKYNVILPKSPVIPAEERPKPQYPSRAFQAGVEGYVTVEYDVDINGNTKNIEVVDASHLIFQRNSIKTIEVTKFEPPLANGQPIEVKNIRDRFYFYIVWSSERNREEAKPTGGVIVIDYLASSVG